MASKTGLHNHLPASAGTLSHNQGSVHTIQTSKLSNGSLVTNLLIPLSELVPVVLDNVIQEMGNHGVQSDLHQWTVLVDNGEAVRRKCEHLAIDFR